MSDGMAFQLGIVMSQAAAAQIKCAAMVEANAVARENGQPLPFAPPAFERLIGEHGLDWNSAVSALQGAL